MRGGRSFLGPALLGRALDPDSLDPHSAERPMTPHDTFTFDNSYATELEGFYIPCHGETAPEPKIVQLNRDLAAELLLDVKALATERGAAIFAGSEAPEGAAPLAQA